MKFRRLKEKVVGTIPQKQALLEQVKQYDVPVLKAVAGFLEASIVADEKTEKLTVPAIQYVMKNSDHNKPVEGWNRDGKTASGKTDHRSQPPNTKTNNCFWD